MSKINKLFQLCVMIFSLSQTSFLYAHAVVTDTSLDIAPIAPHQATQIKLTFNSHLELALSKIFLVSAGDKQQLLQAVKGRSPGKVIVDIPALEPGEYALKFTVFAADGHLTEDIIRFQVNQ